MKLQRLIYLIITAPILFSGCGNKDNADEQSTQSIKYVKVESVESATANQSMTLHGSIKEKSLTELSFRVGGILTGLNVKPGDYVRKGEVLANIDKRDYSIHVKTTKARLEQAEGEYNRYKVLVDENKIPENTFERIESAYLISKSAHETAKNQLADTELKAPVSGFVFKKHVENHQTVGAGVSILSIIDNSQLEVLVPVPESKLKNIRNSKKTYLNVANAGVKNVSVELHSIGKKAQDDGLYEVKYILKANQNSNIIPGMTAEIISFCQAQENRLSISGSAVFHENAQSFVWVYHAESQKVTKRKVQVSFNGPAGTAHVVSGLSPGENIVSAGVNYLIDGQEVKLIQNQSETNIGGLL